MKFSKSLVAKMQQKSAYTSGDTFAELVRFFLSGEKFLSIDKLEEKSFRLSSIGYTETLDTEIAEHAVFSAQQIIALPIQRLSAQQFVTFFAANPGWRESYSLFSRHSLGFTFLGMAGGQTELDAKLNYHALQVKLALIRMKAGLDAVKPSQAALEGALSQMPVLAYQFPEQVAEIKANGGPLYTFHVAYTEDATTQEVLVSEFQAEDFQHAMEQAQNSYPDAVLIHAFEPDADLFF